MTNNKLQFEVLCPLLNGYTFTDKEFNEFNEKARKGEKNLKYRYKFVGTGIIRINEENQPVAKCEIEDPIVAKLIKEQRICNFTSIGVIEEFKYERAKMTKSEITESKTKSEAKYRKRQEAAKARKELIKRGNQYVLERDMEVYQIVLQKERIAVGILRSNAAAWVSFAFCSKKDTWSDKIAKGLVGARLQDGENNKVYALLQMNKAPSGVILNVAIGALLEDCYKEEHEVKLDIPQRLTNKAGPKERPSIEKNLWDWVCPVITKIR